MRTSTVKIFRIAFVSTAVLLAPVSFAWQAQPDENPPYGYPPDSRMESRFGQPDRADVIAHKHLSKGTHLKCIQVEHNPQRDEGEVACLVKFEEGDKYTLHFGESMKSSKDGEVYLECLGGKPSRCVVGTW